MADAIHADLMAQHGGLRGIRDENALESVLVRPRNRWAHDAKVDIAALAAAYGFGIARGHPYNDGNKRSAFMLPYVLLGLNGWELEPSEADVVQRMVALADHPLTEDALTDWIRTVSVRRRRK